MSYLAVSSSLASGSTRGHNEPSKPHFVALNFMTAITSTDLLFSIKNSTRLQIERLDYRIAGTGGFSVVEVGKDLDKRLVAVKVNRNLVRPLARQAEGNFDNHLEQLCLELRILSHKSLATHPNIINLLGISVDHTSGYPLMSLVLEHSEFGSLDMFLKHNQGPSSFDDAERLQLAHQVSCGLSSLHGLKVCHGDVKMQNSLVFQEGVEWRVKISDFGQSLIASQDDFNLCSGNLTGTAIYNAPELRKGVEITIDSIEGAIATDVFSFGLLLWEVLKNGERYTDYLLNNANIKRVNSKTEEDGILYLLQSLNLNELQEIATSAAQIFVIDDETKQRVLAALRSSLQDIPEQRASMLSISQKLDLTIPLVESVSSPPLQEEIVVSDGLISWTSQSTLYDFIEANLALTLDEIPSAIWQRARLELESVSTCKTLTDQARASAAMTLSEFYTVGYGGVRNNVQVVEWLCKAALFGDNKAMSWIHRIAGALGVDPGAHSALDRSLLVEKALLGLSPQQYLSSRIRQCNEEYLKILRHHVPTLGSGIRISLFNQQLDDEITDLHLACWIGDNGQVSGLLGNAAIDVKSSIGLTPVHYACAGGHLSTLCLLLDRGASLITDNILGITPLHLCIFFTGPELNIATARLLNEESSMLEKQTGKILFDDHDILLHGRPLDWAVSTRNYGLLSNLLPYERGTSSLRIAISLFFWEMVEMITQHLSKQGPISWKSEQYFDATRSPFCHWISHGTQLFPAIKRTINSCYTAGIEFVTSSESISLLSDLISSVQNAADFALLEGIITFSTSYDVKKQTDSDPPLFPAIGRSGSDEGWTGCIESLLSHYTREELELPIFLHYNPLHLAVTNGSVVAVRLLLERGVDVNQRMYDENKETAMHLCLSGSPSTEMFELLMRYNANLEIRSEIARQTPLEALIFNWQAGAELVEHILQVCRTSYSPGQLFHLVLQFAVSRSFGRNHSRNCFKHLLGLTDMRGFLNHPREDGATLLHIAATFLDSEVVNLLLEAGANAEVPMQIANRDILPLQIVCAIGRGARYFDEGKFEASFDLDANTIREKAMKLGIILLQWHQVRGRKYFCGITELHLATYIAKEAELGRGQEIVVSTNSSGFWPGIEHAVAPAGFDNALNEELQVILEYFSQH